jgi:hypothetical protein
VKSVSDMPDRSTGSRRAKTPPSIMQELVTRRRTFTLFCSVPLTNWAVTEPMRPDRVRRRKRGKEGKEKKGEGNVKKEIEEEKKRR